MPWVKDDVDEFVEGLTEAEKEQWVKVANGVYGDCMEENDDDLCAPRAIRIANEYYDQEDLEADDMKTKDKKMLAQVRVEPVPEDIRSAQHNGRDHLVIPVVALREGVVKGQFLPGEEIQNSKTLWDDMPTPVQHPKGASARERKVVDENSLGRFYNVHFEDNKLKGEIWVDEEKAIQARTENSARSEVLWGTYKRLKAGEAMDVSTSYWHDTLDESGTYNGKHYNGVQVNIRPDHLAILPDQQGELSLPDGVGVPLKNRGDVDMENEKVGLQEIRKNVGLVQRIINTFRGENMEKQELVQTLLSRGVDIPEDDLLDMKQENLEAVEKVTEEEEPEEEEEESETTASEEPEEESEGKQENALASLVQNAQNGGAELQDIVQKAVRAELDQEKKSSLVDKLDNSKKVSFSRDELKAMPVSALKKVENDATPGSYQGAGGSMAENSGVEEVELIDSKPILTATEGSE